MFPIQILIVPIFLGVAVWYALSMRKRMAQTEADHAHLRIGALAPRLGMQVMQGDPTFNLIYNARREEFGRAMTYGAADTPSVALHLAGSAQGRPVELVYRDQIQVEDPLIGPRAVTLLVSSWMAVGPRTSFPPFEVYLRSPTTGMEAQPVSQLPYATFGDATLDRTFILRCADARLGPAIGPHLAPLLAYGYVHLVGSPDPSALRFVMTSYGAYVGFANPEAVFFVLQNLACVMEGVPASTDLPPTPGTLPGAAPSADQVPMPCTTCGAPMREQSPDHLHGTVIMVCDYCRATAPLPADAAARVTALRARLAQLKWAQEAMNGPARAIQQVLEAYRNPALLAMFGLMLVVPPVFGAVGALQSGQSASFALFTALQSMSVFGGIAIGYALALREYRTHARPALLARAPVAEGAPLRCRRCGGALPGALGASSTCTYCGAHNLVSKEIAADRAAALDREVRTYQARAAGAQQELQQTFDPVKFYVRFGVGAVGGFVLAGAFGFVASSLR